MDGSHEDGPYLGERLARRHSLRAATAGVGGLLLPLASLPPPSRSTTCAARSRSTGGKPRTNRTSFPATAS